MRRAGAARGRKTGKTAPDGSPDPSIFSTSGDPVGIQVGTAITTLVRKANHAPADAVGFRHLWGQAKRADLTATAEDEPGALYEEIAPILPLGLPFVRTAVSEDWFDWPALPDLFPVSFPGVKTSRDGFLVDVDLARVYFCTNRVGTLNPADVRAARRRVRRTLQSVETGFGTISLLSSWSPCDGRPRAELRNDPALEPVRAGPETSSLAMRRISPDLRGDGGEAAMPLGRRLACGPTMCTPSLSNRTRSLVMFREHVSPRRRR